LWRTGAAVDETLCLSLKEEIIQKEDRGDQDKFLVIRKRSRFE
jgi:hypothetical protein